MSEERLECAVFEIESLRQLHRCCPLLDYEVNKLNALTAMIMRHDGDFSHPMLLEKNRRLDTLSMLAWNRP